MATLLLKKTLQGNFKCGSLCNERVILTYVEERGEPQSKALTLQVSLDADTQR